MAGRSSVNQFRLEGSAVPHVISGNINRYRANAATISGFLYTEVWLIGRLLLCHFVRIFIVFFVVLFGANGSVAAQSAPFNPEELTKRFNPKPSFDTTPVRIKVASVVYRIPRNYLIFLDEVPTLRVTFPGLEPLIERTRACFENKVTRNNDCRILEIRIHGSGGPGAGGLALTRKEMIENFKAHFPAIIPRSGPHGFLVYELGPENARSEFYWREEDDLFFRCSVNFEGDSRGEGVCDDSVPLNDKNHAGFFFRRSQIGSIPEIEAAIRKLMDQFVVREDNK